MRKLIPSTNHLETAVPPQGSSSASLTTPGGVEPTQPVIGSEALDAPAKKPRRLYTPGRSAYQPFDVKDYLRKAKLCPQAEAYILKAFEAPSRAPNGYVSNTLRYPCHRFGYTIGAESRNFEYTFLLIAAQRPDALAVLDQPPPVHIKARTPEGRPYSIDYTPDYLILTWKGVEIYEVKPKEEIASLCIKHPNRYQQVKGQPGVYDSIPVREYYEVWGFKFSIVTERNLNGPFAKNTAFLHPYVTGIAPNAITQEDYDRFVGWVRHNPGARLYEMACFSEGRRAELAFHFLAKAEVYTHLSDCDLRKPQTLRLYPSAQDEYAFHQFLVGTRQAPADLKSLGYILKAGSLVEICGVDYQVTRIDEERITLKPEGGSPLPPFSHQQLLDAQPKIGGIFNADKTFEAMYRDAGSEDLAAYLRYKMSIQPYLKGGALEGKSPKDRTIRRNLSKFENAESSGLSGDAAIFPKHFLKGKAGSKFPPDVENEMQRLIRDTFLTAAHCDPTVIESLLIAKFGGIKRASDIPELRTIYRRIRQIDPERLAKDRYGKRHSRRHQKYFTKSEIAPPVQGQRSFMVAHVDCSKIDMATPGDALMQASMVDGFTGQELANVIARGSPNGALIRRLILDCLARHGTLPSSIVTDWGTENETEWMTASMAKVGIICQIRPKADPRKGSGVEASFSALCRSLINNLDGNTELMKQARMVTKAVNPHDHAVWTEEELIALIEEYHALRNDLPRGDRASPNAIALECDNLYGPPPLLGIKHEELQRVLLPLVRGAKRKVSPRGAVRCNKKVYFSDDLRDLWGKKVDVRFDPDDATKVYVLPPGRDRTIPCQICGRGFEDQEILAAAKRHDDAKVSPIVGIPYVDAVKAQFVEKTFTTQDHLRSEKRKRHKPTPRRQTDVPSIQPSGRKFQFEPYSRQ